MPVVVRGHSFDLAPNSRRTRDVAFYRCSRCGKSARVYTRTLTPLEQRLAHVTTTDCTGDEPPPAPAA